jgi:predicted amidohydrolase YtcJ
MWVLNSSAIDRLRLDEGVHAPGVARDATGRATGRLLRLDGWLRDRMGPRATPDLGSVGRKLASFGVTGVTDATVSNAASELAELEAAVERGALRQRVVVMGGDDLPQPTHPLVSRGARQVMLAESRLPPFGDLVTVVQHAHRKARPVAVHCVTRAELVFAVEAFREAGARDGDRIEHGAVLPPELLELVAALPLRVVTQPNFVFERGDAYLTDVEPADRPWLYRARGLCAAGIPLAAGTDAPFGAPDPWAAMHAAVERRTADGQSLGAEESLTPEQALALFTTSAHAPGAPPLPLAAGEAADLCLLDRPWSEARSALSSAHVRATWRAGTPVWERD